MFERACLRAELFLCGLFLVIANLKRDEGLDLSALLDNLRQLRAGMRTMCNASTRLGRLVVRAVWLLELDREATL